ncbi:MAG: 50S ribosomal protein L21 [Candidatus Marinimicrobia bacterium]|nr:50S ribosomal protein L21 [Candidatus Neomarinimicrobiota bacterium]
MYAVVEIKGMQFKVQPDAEITIPKTDAEEGDKLKYDKVLFLHDGKKPHIGTPTVDGAEVEATVVGHGKDKKIVVFKKKRRKGYRRKKGHRQQFTSIHIDKIKTKSKKSTAAKKKTEKPKPEAAAEEKSEE